MFLLRLIENTPGAEIGRVDLHVSSLAVYAKKWSEIEKECSSNDHPPDEIFRILEELWTILLVFLSNFHQTKDGVLFRLRPLGPLERLYNLV